MVAQYHPTLFYFPVTFFILEFSNHAYTLATSRTSFKM